MGEGCWLGGLRVLARGESVWRYGCEEGGISSVRCCHFETWAKAQMYVLKGWQLTYLMHRSIAPCASRVASAALASASSAPIPLLPTPGDANLKSKLGDASTLLLLSPPSSPAASSVRLAWGDPLSDPTPGTFSASSCQMRTCLRLVGDNWVVKDGVGWVRREEGARDERRRR